MHRSLALAAIVLGGLAPSALADVGHTQPSASERLIRQEDARRNDPRLGISFPSAPQPTAIERLVRQEDARPNDPRLGIRDSQPAALRTPAVHVLAGDGFDWLAAGIGLVAGMATALLALGLTIVARTRGVGRA